MIRSRHHTAGVTPHGTCVAIGATARPAVRQTRCELLDRAVRQTWWFRPATGSQCRYAPLAGSEPARAPVLAVTVQARPAAETAAGARIAGQRSLAASPEGSAASGSGSPGTASPTPSPVSRTTCSVWQRRGCGQSGRLPELRAGQSPSRHRMPVRPVAPYPRKRDSCTLHCPVPSPVTARPVPVGHGSQPLSCRPLDYPPGTAQSANLLPASTWRIRYGREVTSAASRARRAWPGGGSTSCRATDCRGP
jgi:hypothetical protein